MARPRRTLKDDKLKVRAKELFNTFEIGLSRAILEGDPRNTDALMMLGHALTRSGRHRDALGVDLRLIGLRPSDPVVFYNLACSYSQVEDLDGAFGALHRAFELGYRDYQHMLRDPDLENVRRDRRFKALLQKKWGKRQP